jgi:hypothetical protein
LLGFRGGAREGNQNIGDAEAIWGVDNGRFAAAMGTVGSGGQIWRSPATGACMGVVGEGAQEFWPGAREGEEKVSMVMVSIGSLG